MKKLAFFILIPLLAASSLFAGQFPDISLEDLKKAMKDGSVTIIDVNGTTSYNEGHIPGAIDYIAVKEDLASKLPKEKDALIVAYCSSEACSAYAEAAEAAKQLGYTNVKHYAPGLAGWKAAGEPLQKG